MSADEDIGNFVFSAIVLALVVVVMLIVACHAVWHHLRWTP